MVKDQNKLPSREERYKMVETLREASEGKLFLEREYAQVTRMLCEMMEQDGKEEEATKIIQEIQIETYGSLEMQEKVEFILYQMKLVLARKDYVRVQILSRKISKRHIAQKGLEAHKIEFYTYMIHYYIHEKKQLEAAQCYQTIYDTFNGAEDHKSLEILGQSKVKSF